MQKAVAKAGDAGFRIDLVAGTFAGLEQSAGLRIGDNADLQQAFVSYIAPLGSGLRFDAGKFVTHMGYELIEGYDGYNDNYSRSLLFNYAIPLTHTGVKASYSLNPEGVGDGDGGERAGTSRSTTTPASRSACSWRSSRSIRWRST